MYAREEASQNFGMMARGIGTAKQSDYANAAQSAPKVSEIERELSRCTSANAELAGSINALLERLSAYVVPQPESTEKEGGRPGCGSNVGERLSAIADATMNSARRVQSLIESLAV